MPPITPPSTPPMEPPATPPGTPPAMPAAPMSGSASSLIILTSLGITLGAMSLPASIKWACGFTWTTWATAGGGGGGGGRSEEHTSELQSLRHLVCRLLLDKRTQRIARELGRT